MEKEINKTVKNKQTFKDIPGAPVYIPELKTGAIADKNGIYKIDNLPRVKVIIQVSFLGYKSDVENVDLATTSSRDIVLEQAITEINEVVITGSSRATEISRTPVPMIIVNIEIVKGPASLIYGSYALAGVVNLLPAQPVPDGTIKGHAETNYQTNNGLFCAHIAIAGNHNGFIWGEVAYTIWAGTLVLNLQCL